MGKLHAARRYAKLVLVSVFISLTVLYLMVNVLALHLDSQRDRQNALRNTRPPFCTNEALSENEIANMAKFIESCSVSHTSKLPKVKPPDVGNMTKSFLFLARNPAASRCTCARKLKVADYSIPTSALLSFPGSGNTWVRHLIQQLTGLHSGNVYRNSQLVDFPYEGETKRMIVVKTHRPPQRDGLLQMEFKDGSVAKVNFDQLVIILRNPFAALMAEYKRSTLNVGKVNNAFIDSSSEEWSRFVQIRGRNWGRFVKQAFNTTLPSHVLFYEGLKSCLLQELVRTAYFFRSNNLHQFSFCCALKESEGIYHRTPSNQTIDDVYSADDRKYINAIIMDAVCSVKSDYPQVASKLVGYVIPER